MWFTIIILSLIVFASRYLFLSPNLPIKLHPHLQGILSFASPAVLTAIWVPIVFFPEGELALGLDNPYLIGAILAAGLAYFTKNILLTSVLSMIVFFVLKMNLLA